LENQNVPVSSKSLSGCYGSATSCAQKTSKFYYVEEIQFFEGCIICQDRILRNLKNPRIVAFVLAKTDIKTTFNLESFLQIFSHPFCHIKDHFSASKMFGLFVSSPNFQENEKTKVLSNQRYKKSLEDDSQMPQG
jgi:hypothetical protein